MPSLLKRCKPKKRFVKQGASAFRWSLFALAIFAFVQTGVSQTLVSPPSAQITGAANDRTLVTLEGNTDARRGSSSDQGPVAPSMRTGKIRLIFRRDQTKELELRTFLNHVQDPHSVQYHKWVTPVEYGIRFGIAEQDLSAARNWLRQEGFNIEGVPDSRNFIEFSGTIGQVEHAFHTGLETYSIGNAQYFSNTVDPRIPAVLASIIAGVSPLNTIRAQARQVVYRSSLESPKPDNDSSFKGLAYGILSTTPLVVSQSAIYITPADAATVYNSPNVLNRNFKGGAQQTGSGVNIGIAGYSDLPTADYLNYRKLFLNESVPAELNLIMDGTDPGVLDQHDGQVTLIDTEIAAGLAPQANIYVYSSQSDLLEDGLTNAVIRAIEDNLVAILSVSYAKCEASLGASGNLQWNELWKQASAQGISVVAAAGDSGTAGCDSGPTASGGLTVNGIASTPYDLAVGGTDFDVLGSDFSTYVDTANVGTTLPYQSFITGYIPENPWNDSISNAPPGLVTTNMAAEYNFGAGPTSILSAGGGGASSLAFCAAGVDSSTGNCLGPLTGYATPPFQSAVNAGANAPVGVRYLPDVALFAGTNTLYPAVWAACSDNLVAQANYTFTDCNPTQDGTFSVEGAGGTGTATAAFAGILGMVLQSLGPNSRVGVANNVLYNIYASGNRASVFHDVTAGNNSVPCVAGSPDCGANNFLAGYDAGPGYDPASGLGSVDVTALIAAWPTVHYTATSTTLSANGTVAPLVIRHGTPVMLAATITPSTATGAVSVNGFPGQGGAAVQEIIPLLGGAGSISTSTLPGGSYTVDGYYPGDVNDSPSTALPGIQITVTPEDSALQLFTRITNVNTTQAYSGTFPYGAYGFVYVKPVSADAALADSSGPATGVVTLLNHGTPLSFPSAPSQQIINSVGRTAFPTAVFTPGNYSLGATYSGDRSYNASSTTADTVITVEKGNTRLSAKPLSSTIDISATATITITLDSDSTGQFPSGIILLRANGKSFLGTTQQVLTGLNAVEEVTTFQVAGSALVIGANTLTAAYNGDGNYNGSSTIAIVTVTGGSTISPPPQAGATFRLTGPPAGITVPASAASAAGTVNISAVNGFSGLVNLSCVLAAVPAANAPICSVTPSVSLQAQSSSTARVTINRTSTNAYTMPQAGKTEAYPFPIRVSGEESLVLCSALLFVIPARRRALRYLSIVTLAAGMLGIFGCGVHRNQIASQAADYTAVVTGTSGSNVVSTQISVMVQ